MLLFIYIYFSKSLVGVIIALYFIGFQLSGKSVVNYVYGTEFLPKSKRIIYGSLLNFVDGTTLIWSSIYFSRVPYWKPLFYFVFL